MELHRLNQSHRSCHRIFFRGAVDAQAKDAEDAMNAQRLVQVKFELTRRWRLSAFKYTSNPEKAASPTKDGTTADLSLPLPWVWVNMAGEVICTPSFMFMQMRLSRIPFVTTEMKWNYTRRRFGCGTFPFILPRLFLNH